MNLSANFTLKELTASSHREIDNTPSLRQIDCLQKLVDEVLQPLRVAVGPIKVNSGFRCPALNKAVGGSSTSEHMQGMAADIECTTMSNVALAKYIADNMEFTQVILEFYTPGDPHSGWVHVSYNPDNLKKQTLTASRVNGKTIYSPGINP